MKKGIFVTFEGGEGSGKTTLVKSVYDVLNNEGIAVLITREPGGCKIAENIRNIILDKNNTNMDARTEALLYAAARSQFVREVVEPALNENKIVLSDRYVDSSLVYQGYARGLGIDEIWKINKFAMDDVLPDITFFLDIKPEEGLARIKKYRSNEVNRLDLEGLDFHKKVYDGYKKLLKKFPDRIIRVDATDTVENKTDFIIKQILLKTGIH